MYFFSFLDAIKLKFFSEDVVRIKQSAFLSTTSDNSLLESPTRGVDEQFSARSKIIIKNSVSIRGIKKRELVDMYRDNFQNILRKQRPSLFILGSFI